MSERPDFVIGQSILMGGRVKVDEEPPVKIGDRIKVVGFGVADHVVTVVTEPKREDESWTFTVDEERS